MAARVIGTFLALLALSHLGTSASAVRDLSADVESAHYNLTMLTLQTSTCFFRTNDIRNLINGDVKANVTQIATYMDSIAVDEYIVTKFRADMNQTALSANNLLQLELNTFEGYEERTHTYAENLLINLQEIPGNVDQLTKDTETTKSIFSAVDNNLVTYVNFLTAEVNAIVGDDTGFTAGQIKLLLNYIKNAIDDDSSQLRQQMYEFGVAADLAIAALDIVSDQV